MWHFYLSLCLFIASKECLALNFDAVCPGIAIPECRPIDSPEPDYYWRPYNGDIPKDAIKGGYDSRGNITYIGQIPITSFAALNPATIHPGKKAAVTSYNGHYSHDKDVKILCSRNIQNFEWIRAKTEDLHLLTDYHLIVGGFEVVNNKFLRIYIGRLGYDNSVIVGKVFPERAFLSTTGIKIPAPNGREAEYQSFELLVYRRPK